MEISFYGACRQVTGSCHYINTGKSRFLIDCGVFQGTAQAEKQNYAPFGFDPARLDFVIATHAHADHIGRLPKLCRDGFAGKIYSTPPTKDLIKIMLADAVEILEYEAKKYHHQPLYSKRDVQDTIQRFIGIDYRHKTRLAPDVELEFYDAGHILGSAFVVLTLGQGKTKKRVVFSGDLGNPPVPLLRDTEFVRGADVVIMETTYGGRIHEPASMRLEMLKSAFGQTAKNAGVLLIPVFALERTQEILYELNHLVESGKVPAIPVYVDSPLAIEALQVYRHYQNLFDQASQKLLAKGDNLFDFPGLKYTKTASESKKINTSVSPKVIIAGSGMANGGRILHHLPRYLPGSKNQLLIVGYQAQGTLGRELYEGKRVVKIDGQLVPVKARVTAIGAYSAHADQPKLLHWVKKMSWKRPSKVFLIHGETKASQMVADGLKQKLKINSIIPEPEKVYEL
ncbi:MAG: MBL fold metallo-hydrolase [Patescibacteria group bacterium]|jgi:metallo-beta-lactamase family protein|nr:MBL fold metallo-hydrolase [Patescibacteria group bacterium]